MSTPFFRDEWNAGDPVVENYAAYVMANPVEFSPAERWTARCYQTDPSNQKIKEG